MTCGPLRIISPTPELLAPASRLTEWQLETVLAVSERSLEQTASKLREQLHNTGKVLTNPKYRVRSFQWSRSRSDLWMLFPSHRSESKAEWKGVFSVERVFFVNGKPCYEFGRCRLRSKKKKWKTRRLHYLPFARRGKELVRIGSALHLNVPETVEFNSDAWAGLRHTVNLTKGYGETNGVELDLFVFGPGIYRHVSDWNLLDCGLQDSSQMCA